jgi:hypothetical protein
MRLLRMEPYNAHSVASCALLVQYRPVSGPSVTASTLAAWLWWRWNEHFLATVYLRYGMVLGGPVFHVTTLFFAPMLHRPCFQPCLQHSHSSWAHHPRSRVTSPASIASILRWRQRIQRPTQRPRTWSAVLANSWRLGIVELRLETPLCRIDELMTEDVS